MIPDQRVARRIDAVESIKAFGLVWIVWNHMSEEIFSDPYFANPSKAWPVFSDRLDQLTNIDLNHGWDWFAAAFRLTGWLGDQAVGLFLVASGFGLAWSHLHKAKPEGFRQYLMRRLSRIYPIWITAHLLILLPPALVGWNVSVVDWNFPLSMAGFRILRSQMYYGVPAWWFVSLILQLYLIFPFLIAIYRRLGPTKALLATVALSLSVRMLGMLVFDEYLDPWCRGVIFISRLAEFSVGIWFAIKLHCRFESTISWGQHTWVRILAFATWLLGNCLSLVFWGNAVSPLLMTSGAGLFLFVTFSTATYRRAASSWVQPMINWLSRHSISLFLVHQPVCFVILPRDQGASAFPSALANIVVTIGTSIIAAYVLEFCTAILVRGYTTAAGKWGHRRLFLFAGCMALLVTLVMVPLELAVRRVAPQDVPDFGWAERPSLQPDERLGYRLRPSSKTRLRWESYDYFVESNSEGFPAPDFEATKPPNTYRIMTLGDAFTSAEGVDTNQSWPRRLENKLNLDGPTDRTVEVLNFGVTGFGPDQYLDIVRQYAESTAPDLIIIGSFTNDFQDVLMTADEMQKMVGFDKAPPDCLRGYVTGRHCFRLFRGYCIEYVYERMFHRPSPHTRFFLQLDMFQRSNLESMLLGQDEMQVRFQEIASVAERLQARVLLMAIPAPIQVADRNQLKYWRPFVGLGDPADIDLDQPQRLAKELSVRVGFEFLDLRPALRSVKDRQPYQPHNLHWTIVGHEAAAEALVPVVQRIAER